jgi:hypothetical protein
MNSLITENLADSVVKYTKDRTDASHVDKFYDMIFYKNLLSLANWPILVSDLSLLLFVRFLI